SLSLSLSPDPRHRYRRLPSQALRGAVRRGPRDPLRCFCAGQARWQPRRVDAGPDHLPVSHRPSVWPGVVPAAAGAAPGWPGIGVYFLIARAWRQVRAQSLSGLRAACPQLPRPSHLTWAPPGRPYWRFQPRSQGPPFVPAYRDNAAGSSVSSGPHGRGAQPSVCHGQVCHGWQLRAAPPTRDCQFRCLRGPRWRARFGVLGDTVCWAQMVSRVFVRPARVRRPNGLEMPLAEAPPRAAGATFLEDLRAAPLLKPVADRGRPLGDAEFSEQELEIQPSGLWAHPRRTCWGSPRRPFRRGHLVRQSLCGGYVASAKLRSWGYQASPLRSLRERARDAAWHRAWECSAKDQGKGGAIRRGIKN
ncbi:unnamed protein product, partial [Prorocentrum cordatum]